VNIIITAPRFYENAQVLYHLLTHEIKEGDKIILTGAKAPWQSPVLSMCEKLQVPCEYQKEVLVGEDTDFINLSEYEKDLALV